MGGQVTISSTTQTAFPGASTGTWAIGGVFDIVANTYVWLKLFNDVNGNSHMISAISINYN